MNLFFVLGFIFGLVVLFIASINIIDKYTKPKCDCGDPECKRELVVTKSGGLYNENIHTCGKIKSVLKNRPIIKTKQESNIEIAKSKPITENPFRKQLDKQQEETNENYCFKAKKDITTYELALVIELLTKYDVIKKSNYDFLPEELKRHFMNIYSLKEW